MSREVERFRTVCQTQRDEARRVATLNLASDPGLDFRMTGWTVNAREAYGRWSHAQWDWQEIFRRFRDPDRFDIAIWTPENELVALALAVPKGRAVRLERLEGAPDSTNTLKGYRLLIVLEAIACYAQLRGKAEIQLEPLNEILKDLYLNSYGFEMVAAKGQPAYLRRLV